MTGGVRKMATLKIASGLGRLRHEADRRRLGLDDPPPIVRPRDELLGPDDRHARLTARIASRWPAIGVGSGGKTPLLLLPTVVDELAEVLAGEFTRDEIVRWHSWWTGLRNYKRVRALHRGGHSLVEIEAMGPQ
jgi:hypothetical protein